MSGTIVITTDQGTDPVFSGAANLERITATESARVSFTAAQGDDNPTLRSFFLSRSSLQSIAGLSSWDVSNVTGAYCMSGMFYNCSALRSLDALSGWDVSGVAGESCMNNMFFGCSALTSLDGLSDWDVSGVAGEGCMNSMFADCSALTSLDGLSSWDVSGVTGAYCMYGMFQGCTSLKNIEALSSWKLKNAIDSTEGVSSMFGGCPISYIAGAPSADEGFTPTSAMYISNLAAAKTWYPAEGGSSASGDSLLGNWQTYASQSSRWALATDSGGDPYVSTQLSWDPSKLPATYTYTGSLIPYNPEVRAGTQTLTEGTDYRLSYLYTSGNEEKVVGGLKEPGSYVVSVVPQGNYTKAPDNTAKVRVVEGPIPENTGWVWEDTAWRYYTKEGSYLHSGWQWVVDDTYGAHWYYFYTDGFCAMRAWVWDSAWYYMKDDCAMACGSWNWIDGAWYGFNWDGTMCTGWVWDNSYAGWYYCYTNGVMARSTWIDSYYVDDTGRWIR